MQRTWGSAIGLDLFAGFRPRRAYITEPMVATITNWLRFIVRLPRCLELPSFSLYFSRHLKDAPRFSLLIFHFPFPSREAPLTFVNLNCFSLMNARSNRRNQTIRDRRLMGVNSKMNLKGLSLRGRGVDPPPLNAPPPPQRRSGMKCNRERILLMEITRVVGTEGLDSWFISPLSIHDL